jgi:hypothetical protein
VYQLDRPDVILLLLVLGGRRRDVDQLLAPLPDGEAYRALVEEREAVMRGLTFEVVVLRKSAAIGASSLRGCELVATFAFGGDLRLTPGAMVGYTQRAEWARVAVGTMFRDDAIAPLAMLATWEKMGCAVVMQRALVFGGFP